MVYIPDSKIYNLEFADRPGLEVSAKSATLGEIRHVSTLTVNMQEKDDKKRMEVFEFFAKKLISWNVGHPRNEPEDSLCSVCSCPTGEALAPTVESMLCLELDLVMEIITGWVFAVGRVSLPKGINLKSGGSDTLSEEVMRQLETLQNPPTLPQPSFS